MNKYIKHIYKLGIISSFLVTNNVHAGDFYIRSDIGLTYTEKAKSDPELYYSSIEKDTNFKLRNVFSIGAGYTINNNLRTELAFSLNNFEYSGTTKMYLNRVEQNIKFKQKFQAYFAMTNVIYDIKTYGIFTPYIGVGVGYAKISDGDIVVEAQPTRKIDHKAENSGNFTYSLMSGVSIKLNTKLSLEARYVFQDLGEANGPSNWSTQIGRSGEMTSNQFNVKTHSVICGLRFQF